MNRKLFLLIVLFLFVITANGTYAFYVILYDLLPRFITVILSFFIVPIGLSFIISKCAYYLDKRTEHNSSEDKIQMAFLIPSLFMWLVLLIELNTINSKQYFHQLTQTNKTNYALRDLRELTDVSYIDFKDVIIDHNAIIHTRSKHVSNSSGQVKTTTYRHLFAVPLKPKNQSENYESQVWLIKRISSIKKDKVLYPFKIRNSGIAGTVNRDPYDIETFSKLISRDNLILINYSKQSFEELHTLLRTQTLLFIAIWNVLFVIIPYWMSFRKR